MAASYMFDTGFCVSFRSRRRPNLIERVRHLKPGEAVISIITYGDLRLAVDKSANPGYQMEILQVLSEMLRVQDLPASAAEHYTVIRASLDKRQDGALGANDLWIAAHARAAGLTLVTNNERKFRHVPDLDVENWAAA